MSLVMQCDTAQRLPSSRQFVARRARDGAGPRGVVSMDRDQSTMQQMPTAQAAARPLPCGTGCEAHHPRNGDSLHEDWNAAQLLLELRRSVDTTVYDAAAAAALQEAIRAAAAMAPCCTEGCCRPQPALAQSSVGTISVSELTMIRSY